MELATDVTADALVQVKREKEAPELPSHVADAAKAGDLEAVKAWLAQPTADINAEDAPWRRTLLHLSCLGDSTADHVALAVYLLSRGADVNHRNEAGRTALLLAVARHYRSQADMVGLLLCAGSEVNDTEGPLVVWATEGPLTPLVWAIRKFECPWWSSDGSDVRALECVVKLLRAGASLDGVGRVYSNEPIRPIEAFLDRQVGSHPSLHSNEHFVACRAIIAGVRAAGSWRAFRDAPTNPWRAYERVPRKAVLRLRSLVARGRATTAEPPFNALFASPNEIVWHVLSFWDARIE